MSTSSKVRVKDFLSNLTKINRYRHNKTILTLSTTPVGYIGTRKAARTIRSKLYANYDMCKEAYVRFNKSNKMSML